MCDDGTFMFPKYCCTWSPLSVCSRVSFPSPPVCLWVFWFPQHPQVQSKVSIEFKWWIIQWSQTSDVLNLQHFWMHDSLVKVQCLGHHLMTEGAEAVVTLLLLLLLLSYHWSSGETGNWSWSQLLFVHPNVRVEKGVRGVFECANLLYTQRGSGAPEVGPFRSTMALLLPICWPQSLGIGLILMSALCDRLPAIPACKTIPQECPAFSEGPLLLAPFLMPFPPASRLTATPEGVLACCTKTEKYILLCVDGNSAAYFTSPFSCFWNSEIWASVSGGKKRATAAKRNRRWNKSGAGEADTERRKRAGEG